MKTLLLLIVSIGLWSSFGSADAQQPARGPYIQTVTDRAGVVWGLKADRTVWRNDKLAAGVLASQLTLVDGAIQVWRLDQKLAGWNGSSWFLIGVASTPAPPPVLPPPPTSTSPPPAHPAPDLGTFDPLKGGFTPAEAASLTRLARVSSGLVAISGEAIAAFNDPALTGGLRAPIFQALATTARELALATAFLVHANPNAEGDQQFAILEHTSRAGWVQKAKFHFDRVLLFSDRLAQALTSAIGVATTSSSSLWHARQAWLMGNVIPELRGFDWSLPYATPLPADVAGSDGKVVHVGPQVVAVHGDVRVANWSVHRGLNYFFDSLDEGAVPLLWQKSADWGPAATVFSKGMILVPIGIETMLILGNVHTRPIKPPAERPNMNPRMVDVVQLFSWLTCMECSDFTVPMRLNEVLHNGWAEWIRAGPLNSTTAEFFRAGVRRSSDTWRHFDNAAWNLMFFNFTGIPSSAAAGGADQGR